MFKTITTIILTVVAVLFSLQNFDHVSVDILFGKPVSIRLIFVIAIAGVAGYLIRHFIGIGREERLKKQLHALMKQNRDALRRNRMDDESVYDYEEM